MYRGRRNSPCCLIAVMQDGIILLLLLSWRSFDGEYFRDMPAVVDGNLWSLADDRTVVDQRQ